MDISASLGLSRNQEENLYILPVGHAIISLPERFNSPILVKLPKVSLDTD